MLDDLWSHIDWRLTLQWALVCVPWDVMDTIMFRKRNSIISFLPEGVQAWMVKRIDFDDNAHWTQRLYDAATAVFRTGWHFSKALFLLGVIWVVLSAAARGTDLGWQQAVMFWGVYALIHGVLYGGIFRLRRTT